MGVWSGVGTHLVWESSEQFRELLCFGGRVEETQASKKGQVRSLRESWGPPSGGIAIGSSDSPAPGAPSGPLQSSLS